MNYRNGNKRRLDKWIIWKRITTHRKKCRERIEKNVERGEKEGTKQK